MESRPFVSQWCRQPDVLSRLSLSSWPYSSPGLLTWFMPTGFRRRIPVSPDIKACFPCCSARSLAGVSFTMSPSRRSFSFWLFSQHRFRGFSAALPCHCAEQLCSAFLCNTKPQTRLLLRNLSAGRAGGHSLDFVPWRDGPPDPSVRRRSVPRFHSFAGRDGGSLEAGRR